MDEDRFTVLGGEAEAIAARMDETWTEDLDLRRRCRSRWPRSPGPDRTLPADDLEVAVLERTADAGPSAASSGADLPALLPAVEASVPTAAPEPAEGVAPGEGPVD